MKTIPFKGSLNSHIGFVLYEVPHHNKLVYVFRNKEVTSDLDFVAILNKDNMLESYVNMYSGSYDINQMFQKFIDDHDPEYQQYLKLHEKYGHRLLKDTKV